jgi:hypothetical protein
MTLNISVEKFTHWAASTVLTFTLAAMSDKWTTAIHNGRSCRTVYELHGSVEGLCSKPRRFFAGDDHLVLYLLLYIPCSSEE